MPTVLIVEDDPAASARLKLLSESVPKVKVTQAADKSTGLQLIGSNDFDVVVIDIELGQKPKDKYGGFEILSSLQGHRAVALVVSGMSEANLPDIAISLKAYDFVSKPLDDLDFVNKLEHALVFQREASQDQTQHPEQKYPPFLEADPLRKLGFRWKGKPVRLSMTQQRLVRCLVANPGKAIEYDVLKKQLDSSRAVTAIASHISATRKRFLVVDPDFSSIDSEPGKGYVWKI